VPFGGRRAPVAPMLLVAIIFAQLIAGAVMRHTGSGLAVPDFPLAYGAVAPSLSDEAMVRYNDIRAFDYQMAPVERGQIVAHLIHRVGALAVVLAVVAAGTSAFRRRGSDATALRAIAFVAVLIVVQGSLGAYVVWSGKMPVIATAHVAVGAATLAAAWRGFLITRRTGGMSGVARDGDCLRGVALAGAAI